MAMAWISSSLTMRSPIRFENNSFSFYLTLPHLAGEKPTRLVSELCCCHFCDALKYFENLSPSFFKIALLDLDNALNILLSLNLD